MSGAIQANILLQQLVVQSCHKVDGTLKRAEGILQILNKALSMLLVNLKKALEQHFLVLEAKVEITRRRTCKLNNV